MLLFELWLGEVGDSSMGALPRLEFMIKKRLGKAIETGKGNTN